MTMPALFAHSEPRRVKIDFAGSRTEHEGGPPPVQQTGARHDGTRDIGQPGGGSRVLLLRGLDPGTYAGEVVRRLAEEITRMLGKGSQRDAEACIARVVMVVDRASSISWGFAFVELVTPELASALMPFLFLPQHQPNGFLISGVPVAASFANPAAFIPTPTGPNGGQYLLQAASDGGIGAGTIASPDGEYCAYWHQQAGAVETVPRGAPPVPARGVSLELSDETRRFLGNLAGKWKPKPSAAAAAAGPTSSMAGPSTSSSADTPPAPLALGAMQPIKIGFGNATKKKAKEEAVMVEIMSKALVDDNDEVDLVGKDSILLSRSELSFSNATNKAAKGAHVIPPTSTSRKVNRRISPVPVLLVLTPTLGRRLYQQVELKAGRTLSSSGPQGARRPTRWRLRCQRSAGGSSSRSTTRSSTNRILLVKRSSQGRLRLRRHAQLCFNWQGGLPAVPAPIQDRGNAPQAQHAI